MTYTLILFVKRNEEINQIFALNQLNNEFERVIKKWENDDGDDDAKNDDNNDLIDIENNIQDCRLRFKILVTMKRN